MSYDPRVGMKVVCVDGKFDPCLRELYSQFPKQDSVYVIREVRLGIKPDCRTGDISLLLVGVVNPVANSMSSKERGFSAARFRPLDKLPPKANRTEVESCIGRTIVKHDMELV